MGGDVGGLMYVPHIRRHKSNLFIDFWWSAGYVSMLGKISLVGLSCDKDDKWLS